jgi:hypothetical protein
MPDDSNTQSVARTYFQVEESAAFRRLKWALIRKSDHVILAKCDTREPLDHLACPYFDGEPDPDLAVQRR